jgi:N-acetylglutamate synthase-like GNAT family acetyltransferase
VKEEVRITNFQPNHQIDIDEMMQSIASEFEQNILTEHYKKIIDLIHLKKYNFWVAIVDQKVVGTIGLVELQDQNAEIKKMFVNKFFRGKNIAPLLLQTLTNWAVQNNFKQIYLGTMAQFKAAQKFYKKNGFEKIRKAALPNDFVINPLDSIFYIKQHVI